MEMATRGPPKSDDFDEPAAGEAHDFSSEIHEYGVDRNERRNRRICMVVTAVIIVILLVLIVVSSKPHAHAETTAGTEIGAVSTTNYMATQVGVEILEAGGNAIDAAAAIQFVLGVVQPQSTGIGGGFYALIYDAADKEVHALDAREEAPAAFHPDIFCGGEACRRGPTNCTCDPVHWEDMEVEWQGRTWKAQENNFRQLCSSGLSVGVPGVPRGVERMVREKGTMTLAQIVAPAVRIARQGFPVTDHFAFRTNWAKERLSYRDASSKLYLNDARDASKFEEGEIFTNPDLADTMERFGNPGGIDDFYEGQVAEDIVGVVNNSPNPFSKHDGVLTKEDMAGYKAVWRKPVKSTYRGYHVYGMGPSTGGGIAMAMMLNYIEGYDLRSVEHNSATYIQLLVDAQNSAYADRNRYLGDEDFIHVPWGDNHQRYCESHASLAACPVGCAWMQGSCASRGLASKLYASQRRQNLSDATAGRTRSLPIPVPPGEFSARYALEEEEEITKPGTTHIAVADRWGNIVSMTTTIEDNMGSGIVVPGRGFLLNNEMTDFSWQSGTFSGRNYANRPEGGKRQRRTALGADSLTIGGKRPRSSMSPTIVLDKHKQPFLAIGSPGGSRITGTVFQCIVAVIDAGLDTLAAISAPRVLARNSKTELENEGRCKCKPGLYENEPLKEELEAKGIQLEVLGGFDPWTYVEAVSWGEDGRPVAHADPRMKSSSAQQARLKAPAQARGGS